MQRRTSSRPPPSVEVWPWASISKKPRGNAPAQDLPHHRDAEHLPYCAVSCGGVIHTLGDVEGDPDHPISRGTHCPKGASLKDDITHKNRILTPNVRRLRSDRGEDDCFAPFQRGECTPHDAVPHL